MAKSKYYDSAHWKGLRHAALKHANYRCADCGVLCLGKKSGGVSPHVDHIKARPYVNGPTPYDVLDNLAVRCPSCHSKKTTWVDHNTRPQTGADGLPADGSWH